MKKTLYTLALLLLPLLIVSAVRFDFIDRLAQALHVYQSTHPEEKVYLMTDKPFYKPGERIWYKAFLVDASTNKPSVTSDVLYVELIDPKGNVLQQHELNTQEGTCAGSFVASATGGLYTLKAYTNWMRNQGEETFFTKELTIQKVITPRLLLTLDYAKRAYGAGDEVTAHLNVTDLSNNKTTGSQIRSTIRIAGTEVQTLTDETKNGEASITFRLPQDLNTTDGILQIIVADKGMEESITRSIPIVLNKIALRFFPEGGSLVEGASCRVAFEALNEYGKGADVKGRIIDGEGNEIVPFESFHLGMGAFVFTPQAGKTYYAQLMQPQEAKFPLPQADKNGFVLKLTAQTKEHLLWDIYVPEDSKRISLVGQTQKQIHYSKMLTLHKGWNKVDVPTADFPMGIAVFTLFNSKEQETCERLVFLHPEKKLHINLHTDKETYAPLEEVQLTVKTTDEQGRPVAANIGVAVVDEQLLTMADDKQDNLLSYLLFSSELKGKIEEPSFYFDPEEPKAKAAIDYLMLTHGWRGFAWKEVLNPSKPENHYFAEKVNDVYGYVLNSNGHPTQADVYLIETDGRKRIAKLRTTQEGHFVFHDVDFSDEVYVTTRVPNKVVLLNGKPEIALPPAPVMPPLDTQEMVVIATGEEPLEEPDYYQPSRDEVIALPDRAMEARGSANDQALSEVVVVGYGVQSKQMLAGAVREVNFNSGFGMLSDMHVRGIASQAVQAKPLVVLNGIALNNSSWDLPWSTSRSVFDYINPEDIFSVNMYWNASATGVFGSRAANGVIEITTKNPRMEYTYREGTPRYAGTMVQERYFYASGSVYFQTKENPRLDNTTVCWDANVRTDEEGVGFLRFRNSSKSSTFRITAEGVAVTAGLIGSETKRIVTQQPLSIDMKVPLFVATGDDMVLTAMVRNMTDSVMTDTVTFYLNHKLYAIHQPGDTIDGEVFYRDVPRLVHLGDDFFSLFYEWKRVVSVPAGETENVQWRFLVDKNVGTFDVYAKAQTEQYTDSVTQEVTVRNVNFPYTYSFAGNDSTQTGTFTLPDYVEGTLHAEATLYVSVLDELIDGVESIFRVPSGCFEQLSSATFPNIFALQLLKATGQTRPEIEQKAMQYIQTGYEKLAAYEVKSTGGFEWYGGTPAHEVLSAYGLVEFYEMAKVYPAVDKAMMNRTLSFILSRRDGKGGFKQNRGKYGFSAAPEKVNNANIVYALTETEHAADIEPEYQSALKEAMDSKDMYRMALMANAAYNMKDTMAYRQLTDCFVDFAQGENVSLADMKKIESTIVYSYGEAKQRETVAFWLMALLKDSKHINLIDKCVNFIQKGRSYGGFGNSQTTSVCLQALTEYVLLYRLRNDKGGEFCLTVNNDSTTCRDIKTIINRSENKSIVSFAEQLKKGKNSIRVDLKQCAYPYGVNVSWQSATPPSSVGCPLRLTTTLSSRTVKVNETIRLSVRLQNVKQEGLPMSVAVIGIPGGMSLQAWQLKEMQERGVFDYYEIIDDNLVVYYREFGPGETKAVNLDLKAEVPGTYKGIASSAYQYYMQDFKYWVDGLAIEITENYIYA